MSAVFEFNMQLMPQNVVEIEELGDFGLEAYNDEGFYWYLAVRCIQGIAVMVTCGPLIPDIMMLPTGFTMNLQKIPFREDKVSKSIDFFLNDKKKSITQAKMISFEEAVQNFKELKEYLMNLNEETF